MKKDQQRNRDADEARLECAHASGAAAGTRAVSRAGDARLVSDGIARSHSRQVTNAGPGFIKQRAGEIRDQAARAAREGVHAGGREQLKGHFIEALDVERYNADIANRIARKKLVVPKNGCNPGYDAVRIIDDKFAGGVQQKSSANGINKAIARMEHAKPGSARNGTARVPKDHVAAARRKALDPVTGKPRIRVKGMEFTSEEAGRRFDQGLGDVAKHGTKAGSQLRALAKGGAVGAVVGAGIGAVGEAGALRRGEVTKREFGENRVIDAAEGATGAVAGTLAVSAGGYAATAVLGTAAGTSAVASAGAAGTAVVGAIGGLGSGGAAVASVLGGVTAAAALPVIVGGALALGSGITVSKGFKRVRKGVAARQQRRALEGGNKPRQLPPGGDV